jgi:tetratricopeptide (TPR) repeat protein
MAGEGQHYDFFLSRRGSVAAIAREVADVLTEKGYRVLVQDYDIPLGASFIEAMDEAVRNSRDLVVLFTRDYEQSPYTRKEFTSFEAERAQGTEERHIIVLRCEDVPLRGLLADNVYQDLVGIEDPEERKRRIIAAAERQSQAAPPPPRPFIGVPPRIASFTGRADELDRLDAILMHDKPAAVIQAVGRVAVQGMGGVGKTSLAIEYAHRYRKLYAGVCWCPAETRTGLLCALAALAVTLGAATADEPDVQKAAKAALRRLDEQRATWLLVYDNVASPDEIADLLPSSGARVLITSRFSDWGGIADEVPLDVLPPEQATAFLQSRTGRSDPQGARTLADALGYLPLALDHAAAYCKRTQMHFADYASKASSLINAAPRSSGYPRSVAATFDLAIAEAVAQCQAAETLMAYLAQCAPERIPMTLVDSGVDDEAERQQALAALAEVSLVKHDPFEDGTPAVIVHRLVQMVARGRSQAKGMTEGLVARMIASLAASYPRGDAYISPQSWPLCAQLTPHLLARRDACPDDASMLATWPDLLTRAGIYFRGRAVYSRATGLISDALAIREKALGPEHPDTAESVSNLAALHALRGDLAGARPLYERALTICEKALGPEHPYTAMNMNNLAGLRALQGDFASARPLYERALAIREKELGAEHPETAINLNNFAVVLANQGDFAGARSLYERALAIYEKVRGPEHPETAMSVNNLAGLLARQNDFAGARPLYERALAIREKALGPEHPDTAESVSDIAILLTNQGDFAGARPLYERALAIREKGLGAEHPDTAVSMNNLASLLEQQGDPAGARPLYERALTILEKAHGPEHPHIAATLDNLAILLAEQGDFASARPLQERALAIREKVLGPEHPETAKSVNNLAFLLKEQGDFAGGRPLQERALTTFEKVLGAEHPDTARSLDNLAVLLAGQGDFAGARPLQERALAIREKVLGPEHPDTAESMNNLASLLEQQGDFARARPLHERALAICKNALGSEHRATNYIRSGLSRLLLLTGHSTEALALGETALAAHDKVLGPHHAWTKDSARVTADALDALGRAEEAKALRERYGLEQDQKRSQ